MHVNVRFLPACIPCVHITAYVYARERERKAVYPCCRVIESMNTDNKLKGKMPSECACSRHWDWLSERSICVGLAGTVTDRRSATGKPPLFTGSSSLLCINAIIQVHCHTAVREFVRIFHMSASRASMQICESRRIYGSTWLFISLLLVQACRYACTHVYACRHKSQLI